MDGSVHLDGKVVVVTGAARGQGEAEARALVAGGACVVLTDVLEDEVRAVAASLGAAAVAVRHDVTDADEWAEVVEVATRAFGGVDALVNNAAIHWTRPLMEEDATEMLGLMSVNVIGPLLGMQATVDSMAGRGGGSIVNVSSAAGLQGLPRHAAYGASKWALRGLTKTAALELGSLGVRVNSIHPGPIETEMLFKVRSPESLEAAFEDLPLGRAGRPAEVAALVAYLVSDSSSYVTGAEIAIDGGSTLGTRPVAPS